MVADVRTIRAERGIQPMDALKVLVGIVSGAVATVPAGIQASALVAFLLLMLDTATGIWLACRKGEFRSHTWREQFAAKCLQYLIITGLGAGAKVLTGVWAPLGGAVGIVVGIEAASNLENLARLEMYGGAPLGPFRPLIWKLGKYFAVEETPPVSQQSQQARKNGE